MAAVGGEVEDPLGLDVEGDTKFPEDQLMVSVKQCLLCLESRSVGSARFWLPGYFKEITWIRIRIRIKWIISNGFNN